MNHPLAAVALALLIAVLALLLGYRSGLKDGRSESATLLREMEGKRQVVRKATRRIRRALIGVP